ncbi:unnamed protein product [Urochloa decumbens]|uniref:Uncharacterized protein n=1 Tax=Urochloa decumbens TaxID=240449 RepID=A0ABC9AQL4_9POAL
MAGKEDPMRNFGAVAGGSAPAEKMEVVEEFKRGSVPSALMPRRLPAGRRKLGGKKADLVYGGLRPCSGGHAPTEEEKQEEADLASVGLMACAGGHTLAGDEAKADWLSGCLRPYTGGQTPTEVKADRFSGGLMACSFSYVSAKEYKDKDAVTAEKRKAEEPVGEGGKPAALLAADVSEAAGAGDAKASEIKWVEMPLEYIAWLLSQKREDYSEELDRQQRQRELILKVQATDEAGREEFLAFQEWVRETFERNGRVMVPEGFEDPNFRGIQDIIDEEWEKGRHQLEMIDAYPPLNSEDTGLAMPSN